MAELDAQARALQKALRALREQDFLLDRLLDRYENVTREMYLHENFCGEAPCPLPAELEALLPAPLRIWSPFQQARRAAMATGKQSTAMERAVDRIDAKLRASGRLLTVDEPSDSTTFVATIPARRQAPGDGHVNADLSTAAVVEVAWLFVNARQHNAQVCS